ncbi:hypothetical protein AAEO50_03995 [Rossellomorea oryzaecorticis]|uniref:Uncharacterized protein n=1 Tax=Rossellomorea oryzaecorticis TaxID=1396505 RepID=A0ABU9K948_9BACI
MKRMMGKLSTVLFLLGLAAYITMLFGNDSFLLTGVILSMIGFLFALFARKSWYRRVGLFGNGLIIFTVIIMPVVITTFFWNQP